MHRVVGMALRPACFKPYCLSFQVTHPILLCQGFAYFPINYNWVNQPIIAPSPTHTSHCPLTPREVPGLPRSLELAICIEEVQAPSVLEPHSSYYTAEGV